METNIAPVCRYAFLLEKPVLYIRSVSLEENVVTNVKFLTISHIFSSITNLFIILISLCLKSHGLFIIYTSNTSTSLSRDMRT